MNNLRSLLRVVITAFFAALVALVPGTAHAHTEFDFSLPEDGESVEGPLDEITVAFTLPVTLVGNGFEVLTPAGEIVEPDVSTDDGSEFKLTLDPPLAGGDVGVRYEVRAEDGHVLADGFAFTVGHAPVETTVPATAPPTAPPTTPPTASPTTEPPTAGAPSTTTPAAGPDATGTTAPAPTAATDETTSREASATTITTTITTSDGSDDGGSSAVIWVAIGVIVVAAGAGAFMFARTRRNS